MDDDDVMRREVLVQNFDVFRWLMWRAATRALELRVTIRNP
jgi:hypothetical protein